MLKVSQAAFVIQFIQTGKERFFRNQNLKTLDEIYSFHHCHEKDDRRSGTVIFSVYCYKMHLGENWTLTNCDCLRKTKGIFSSRATKMSTDLETIHVYMHIKLQKGNQKLFQSLLLSKTI